MNSYIIEALLKLEEPPFLKIGPMDLLPPILTVCYIMMTVKIQIR